MIRMNAVRRQQARGGRAVGVRNSVGMDINPKDKTVWFTDNQTDGMGDDIAAGRTEPHHQGWASTSATRTSTATTSRSRVRPPRRT